MNKTADTIRKKLKKPLSVILCAAMALTMAGSSGAELITAFASDASEISSQETDTGSSGFNMDIVNNGSKVEDEENPFMNSGYSLASYSLATASSRYPDSISVTLTAKNNIYYEDGTYHTHYFTYTTNDAEESDYGYAFCMQPKKTHIEGTWTADYYPNDYMRAVLYYGYNGPGYNDSGDPLGLINILSSDYDIVYDSSTQYYAVTHIAASYVYGSSDWNKGVDDDLQTAVKGIVSKWKANTDNIPDSFQVYKIKPEDSDKQDVVLAYYLPTGYVTLKKAASSETVSITAGNCNYSLAGAVYGVYTNSSCTIAATDVYGNTVTLTTDEEGGTGTVEMDIGTYYVKEISASPGYALDTTAYTADVKSGKTATVKSTETATYDPLTISLTKIDRDTGESGAQGSASLAGAQFTVKYYAVDPGDHTSAKSVSALNATRTWVIETDEDAFAMLDDDHLVSGSDDLYYCNGREILPIGVFTVEETLSPEGYTTDSMYYVNSDTGDKTDGAVWFGTVTQDGDLAQLSGGNEYEVSDSIKRGDFSFTKKDTYGNLLSGVPFEITSKSTNESHIVYTNENGYYSTGSDHVAHSYNTNGGSCIVDGNRIITDGVWFGTAKVDDSLGALPYDTYTVTELSCDANADLNLVSFDVTISMDSYTVDLGTVVDGDMPALSTNAKDEDSGTKYMFADTAVAILDTLSYSDMTKGRFYEVVTKLWDATDSAFLKDAAGNEITETTNFIASTRNGTLDIEVTFDASALAGHDVVVFEYIYDKDGELVTFHEDAADTNQTVHFPGVGTRAVDAETGIDVSNADGEVTIVDTVDYSNVKTGWKYTISGTLYYEDTGEPMTDADGREITGSAAFTADGTSGSVEVKFGPFDGSLLAGKSVVAGETLEHSSRTYAVHYDMTDEEQTVHFPEIGTKACNAGTGEQMAPADNEVTINDDIAYSNMDAGCSYTVKAMVYDLTTSSFISGSDGNPLTWTMDFTPEDSDGTVTMPVDIDTEGLAGDTLVVFEYVYYDNDGDEELVGSHEDPDDESQQIHIPEIGTHAADSDTGINASMADEDITVVDRVTYSNLIPGKEYTITGTLYLKDSGMDTEDAVDSEEPDDEDPDGGNIDDEYIYDEDVGDNLNDADETGFVKALDDNGNEITESTTFTPEDSDGYVDITFTFSGVNLAGKAVVAFEDLTMNGYNYAVHADIEDEDQTDYIPEIGTTAVGSDTLDHITKGTEEAIIIDTVAYESLPIGEDFIMEGTLMYADGTPVFDADGNPVTAETLFTTEATDGTVEVIFTFDASGMQGETVVAYEDLLTVDGAIAAVHEDLTDEDQCVKIPVIHTTASDMTVVGEDGEEVDIKVANPDDGTVTVKDVVDYHNLIPGYEYTISGVIMDKETGEPLVDADGNAVTASATFTAETEDGSEALYFTVDGLDSAALVAFESLTLNGAEIAEHRDIEDLDQTAYIPEIGTTLIDSMTENHISYALGEQTLVDTVEYHDLYTGYEYTLKGALMDRETGEILTVGGEEVAAEATFTPDESDGSIELEFTFDATGLEGHDVVAYEFLYLGDYLAASHTDITDESQTVHFPGIKTYAVAEDTGTQTASPLASVRLTDTVYYSNLIPGYEYTVIGTAYILPEDADTVDPETDEPLLIGGEAVTSTVTFTADEADGVVEVPFEIDATDLAGQTIVFFEDIILDGNTVVREHINDPTEEIEFDDVSIEGTASGTKTGDTNLPLAAGTITVIAFAVVIAAALMMRRRRNTV
ncbi:MAG: VaFE repeat-containing surface-anchored protein [Clostridiales bacterium]|nr:VaFE repeat-containing surface-anchored protein [Clostridiales bacterium]